MLPLLLFAVQVNDVAFSSDESHFATCSEDGSVRVWLTSSYELVVQFQVLNQVIDTYILQGFIFWHQTSTLVNTVMLLVI